MKNIQRIVCFQSFNQKPIETQWKWICKRGFEFNFTTTISHLQFEWSAKRNMNFWNPFEEPNTFMLSREYYCIPEVRILMYTKYWFAKLYQIIVSWLNMAGVYDEIGRINCNLVWIKSMGREKKFKLLFITYNCVDLNFLPTFLRTTYGFYNITEIQTAQDIYLQTPI